MFDIKESERAITFEISSEMRNVDRIIRETKEFCEALEVTLFEECKIVLRELLINAIEHGNLKVAERKVICSVELLAADRFTVTVEDQGEGFDYAHLDMAIPDDPQQLRNRGYSLINEFSEEIRFNPSGNRVTVSLRSNRETGFAVEEEEGWTVVRADGDITATVADKFRRLLQELVAQGRNNFRFDLAAVVDLDSVSLSVFIVLYKTLAGAGRPVSLEIVNVNADLANLFHMTKLDELYRISAKA